MTIEEYYAVIKKSGFTKYRPSYEGAAIYQGRDKQFVTIPDAETLAPEERRPMLELTIGPWLQD